MQQYEVELESKTKQISQMQTESAQLMQENSELSQQLYVLKTKVTGKEGAITSDEDRIEKIQKDQMVQLLKRNHDTLMQKYELFRQRNEALEKMAVEKEALYNEMKLDADKTGQDLFRVQKSFEETKNQKEIFEAKVKRLEEAAKSKDEQIKALKVQKEKYEGQSKVLNEQLELIQNSHDQLSAKKSQEVEMLTKEISQLSLKEKDTKQKLHWVENELGEVKDQLRSMTTELDTRTQENDHLISLLEDYEQKVATYEQREKSINALSLESKKRIEEANLERDRVHLKEAQYLRQIDRLEETLKVEAAERKDRHDRLLEAVREKQKTILDSRDDELSELKIKLSEALDKYDKQKVEKDSLQTQLDKMVDQWRKFKEEANQKYEQYSKQINQAEMKNQEHNRSLVTECEKQREETEAMRNERQNSKIEMHELQVKLDGYMRDYERYFAENKRLRELVNTIRDEKDTAISELNRLKVIYHDRVNELNDQCNIKIAQLENQLLEQKEKHRQSEESAYDVMVQQEKISDKWKGEHKKTCEYFEKTVKHMEVENRMLKDKVIQLKSTVSVLREEKLSTSRAEKPAKEGKKESSRSKSKSKQ